MSWSPRTKISLLVGILVAFVLLLAAGIWLVMRSELLAPTRRATADWAKLVFMSKEEAQRQLDTELEKIKVAGEPVTIAEIVPPGVPDAENAAVLYQQAFDELNLSEADEAVLSDLLASVREPPTADAPPLSTIKQILTNNAEPIKLLKAAAQRPKCRFPVNWEAGADAEFPHYGKLRDCAQLLAAEITLRGRSGQMPQALHTAQVSLAMSEAVRAEPMLIGQLVRYAIVAITMRPLQATLSEQSSPTSACQELFDYLAQMEFRQSFVYTLWGERVMSMGMFDDVREHPDIGRYLTGEDTPQLESIYASPRGRKILDMDEAVYLRLMSELIAAVGKPWRECRGIGEALDQKMHVMPRYCIMTAVLMPVFTHSIVKRDVIIAEVGLAQAALTLKAYKNKEGSYPASLEELRQVIPWELREDPFSGEDLIYQREGEGFLIYSIGPNLTDDGGTPSKDWQEGDIIWRCKK